MNRRLRSGVVFLGLAVSLFGATTIAQRTKTAKPIARVFVPLPLTPQGVKQGAVMLALKHRVAMGIEVVIEGAPLPSPAGSLEGAKKAAADRRVPDSGYGYDLSDLTLDAALDKMVSERIAGIIPNYGWAQVSGVHRVRPAGFVNNRDVALSRVFPQVSIQVRGARNFLHEVHKLFDPGYPSARASARTPEHLVESFNREINISLSNVTARDVLDEAARQYGGIAWFAEYAQASGPYRSIRIGLVSPDGWSSSVDARMR